MGLSFKSVKEAEEYVKNDINLMCKLQEGKNIFYSRLSNVQPVSVVQHQCIGDFEGLRLYAQTQKECHKNAVFFAADNNESPRYEIKLYSGLYMHWDMPLLLEHSWNVIIDQKNGGEPVIFDPTQIRDRNVPITYIGEEIPLEMARESMIETGYTEFWLPMKLQLEKMKALLL